MLRKLHAWIQMPRRRKYILLFTVVLSLYSWLLMRFFPKRARFGAKTPPSPNITPDPHLIQDIRFAIHLVGRYTPYENVCRHQAYQAKLLCSHYNIPYQIFVGFKKGASGKIEGHAWTLAQGTMITGFCQPEDYIIQSIYS